MVKGMSMENVSSDLVFLNSAFFCGFVSVVLLNELVFFAIENNKFSVFYCTCS